MFKMNPGNASSVTIESAKRAMAVWEKHGAQPRLWSVTWGEEGCLSVKSEFANHAAYGRIHDLVAAEPQMRAWSTANESDGGSTRIRGGVLREIEV
ncbi:MAG: hypothetical protein R3E68_20765 [Burkholderiaceae bacterium]